MASSSAFRHVADRMSFKLASTQTPETYSHWNRLTQDDQQGGNSMARHEWQPVRKLRTHEHVLGQIAERILDGRLSVGDRLPSERELVSALEVSRTSVREALRILESMGIVEANVGSGRDAGSMICGQPTEALSNMLRL